MENTKSLELARQYLSKEVVVKIDRPLGSKHPKHDFTYEVNYGYIEGVIAPDGEDLDVYVLGISESILTMKGVCIAVVHRNDDDDDALVVVPDTSIEFTNEEIMKKVYFQEQWFDSVIIRK